MPGGHAIGIADDQSGLNDSKIFVVIEDSPFGTLLTLYYASLAGHTVSTQCFMGRLCTCQCRGHTIRTADVRFSLNDLGNLFVIGPFGNTNMIKTTHLQGRLILCHHDQKNSVLVVF